MDLAIFNALIADGSGETPFPGGIVIHNGRIVAVVKAPLPANFAADAATRLDAQTMVLAPGLIDAHGHSDLALLAAPEATGKLAQGITTEIAGNCGLSPFPITPANRDHLEELYRNYGIPLAWNDFTEYAATVNRHEPAINLGWLCGHNTLRAAVRGYGPGESTPAEVATMCTWLRSSLAQGALGLSTGLLYVPGKFATRAELVALLTELAKFARPYATHLRSEGATLLEALDEAIAGCHEAGQRQLHLSHLKTAGEANWGKLEAALLRISQARAQGLAVTADRYPYTTSLTQLSAFLPAPWDEFDDVALTAHLGTPAAVATLEAALAERPASSWERLRLVAAGPGLPLTRPGATFAELARDQACTPAALCVTVLRAGAAVALAAREGMSEENLCRILAEPWVCGGTDERALPADGSLGQGHPRGYGAMARHFRRLLPSCGLGETVRRLTALPAAIFNLRDRGCLAPGLAADLVLLVPEAIADHADFSHPFRTATGIAKVWVNGVCAWSNGASTSHRAGRVLGRS